MQKFNDIHKRIKLNENTGTATPASVNGMGSISLPSVDGGIGSGDVPGATADIKKQKSAKVKMKKFEEIYSQTLQEKKGEIYYNINDFGDTASIILALSSELSKKYNITSGQLNSELLNINISYNGTVDVKSINSISKLIGISSNELKKDINSILDKNIHLLEELLYESIVKLLNGQETINEGIIGRIIGGIGGFALGPTIGGVIARVLGIEKGPIYNLLTSRVVGAALAQELTKNLV